MENLICVHPRLLRLYRPFPSTKPDIHTLRFPGYLPDQDSSRNTNL